MKSKIRTEINDNTILIDTKTLPMLTQSGRDTSIKIGTLAGAKVKIGKSVLWNVAKIKEYIDDISQ